ncbi:hypothetical protein [Rugamonas rivuli]|uniref:CHAT domain-containing protein n=1 Tax=Rugamonas rivuli TaxID=2743358 RepID=A0A843SGR2_9BURK|nr:hypothetical protein [Rugamonas rivuli]MQA21648.1 hypothetical protein [Rugamonas rivuli]
MLDAVAVSGIAEWGGDPAVLNASEWLDLNTALEIAQAFRVVVARRKGDLRLKIQRAIYSWDAVPPIHAICDDLARAYDLERIFVEWPTDRRSRRPPASTKQGLSITSSERLAEITSPLLKSLPSASWGPSDQPATIAVVTLDDLLTNQFSSELLIILDTYREAVIPHVDTIRAGTGAQCAIFLPADQPNIHLWLQVFGAQIAAQAPIDSALSQANREIERSGVFLASTQTFMVQSNRTFFPSARRKRERNETLKNPAAVDSARLAPPARRRQLPPPNLEIEGVRMEAPPPTIRVLDARIEHDGQPVMAFPQDGSVNVQISIQPVSPLKFAPPAFPEQNLHWNEDLKPLQVHLTEVGSEPRSAPLFLPRNGASEPAIFDYAIPADRAIDVRFLVSDGASILQTARLQGRAGDAIIFFVEVFNSPVDHHKTRFDVSLLVNDSLGNTPSATILTSEGIRLTELDVTEIGSAREQLRLALEECLRPKAALNSALFNLANNGKLLLDALKDLTPSWPTTMDRVQLTTPSNGYFPVECLYDGEIPDNEDAALCDDRSGCLTSGIARENCSIRATRHQLCPMGFLGITSVIERRTWDRTMDKTVWLKQATALSSRNRIAELRRVLFAASNRADEFNDYDVPPQFSTVRTQDIELLANAQRKYNWHDWSQAIAAIHPKLLVLVPHIENNHLYIGNEEKLALGSLRRPHIGNSEPVVIAIGCNSAIGLIPNASLPAILLREGAKVVIAATTSVLGRFTNIATADLTSKLMAASTASAAVTIGELVTSMRREFLEKNNALGMALIAFGDADCCLGGGQQP